jgi:hypothetical protein
MGSPKAICSLTTEDILVQRTIADSSYIAEHNLAKAIVMAIKAFDCRLRLTKASS